MSEALQNFLSDNYGSEDPAFVERFVGGLRNSRGAPENLDAIRKQIFRVAGMNIESKQGRAALGWVKSFLDILEHEAYQPIAKTKEVLRFPSEDSLAALCRYITSAQTELLICFPDLQAHQVYDAILDRHRAKVRIRLACDERQMHRRQSLLNQLQAQGVPVAFDLNPDAVMQNSFMVIDKYIVVNGSYRWNRDTAETSMMVLSDVQLAQQYTEKFFQYGQALTVPQPMLSQTGLNRAIQETPKPRTAQPSTRKPEERKVVKPNEETKKEWAAEQNRLKAQLVETDSIPWTLAEGQANSLRYIGGVDLSFDGSREDRAIASLVVLDRAMNAVYEDYKEVQLVVPYIPGFLAFREAPHLLNLIGRIRTRGGPMPEVILVDGNGVLHTRGFGLASHLGVLSGIPTIGVGKTVFDVDGIRKDRVATLFSTLGSRGEAVDLRGRSGRVWGAAFKPTDKATDPLIISIGHRVSLPTALDVVRFCMKTAGLPEPIR